MPSLGGKASWSKSEQGKASRAARQLDQRRGQKRFRGRPRNVSPSTFWRQTSKMMNCSLGSHFRFYEIIFKIPEIWFQTQSSNTFKVPKCQHCFMKCQSLRHLETPQNCKAVQKNQRIVRWKLNRKTILQRKLMTHTPTHTHWRKLSNKIECEEMQRSINLMSSTAFQWIFNR